MSSPGRNSKGSRSSLPREAREAVWAVNPYVVNDPHHTEFQRVVHASTVERLGPLAAQEMRLADFVSQEYHRDVGEMILRAKERRNGGSGSQHELGSAPQRISSGVTDTLAGFAKTHREFEASCSSAFHSSVVASVVLHEALVVWVALSDGSLRVTYRWQTTSTDERASNSSDKPCGPPTRLMHVSELLDDVTESDHRVLRGAVREGAVGDDVQCSPEYQTSRVTTRFHRYARRAAVRHGDDDGNGADWTEDGTRLGLVPTTMAAVGGGNWIVLGLNDGSLQVWDTLTCEGLAHYRNDAVAGVAVVAVIPLRSDPAAERTSGSEEHLPEPIRFLVIYRDGTLVKAELEIGSQPLLVAPSLSQQAFPTELRFVAIRPALVPLANDATHNVVALSVDEATLYVGGTDDTLSLIDLRDYQLAAKVSLDKELRNAAATSMGRWVAAELPHITALDASSDVGDLVALGFGNGACALIEFQRSAAHRRQTVVHAIHTPEAICRASGCSAAGPAIEALVVIPATREAWVVLRGGRELVTWSLDRRRSFAVHRRYPLTISEDVSTLASAPSRVDLSVHLHVDATEVWTCGTDRINFLWVRRFARAQEALTQVNARSTDQQIADTKNLVAWEVDLQRSSANADKTLFDSVNALCQTAHLATYLRYYWRWKRFRLHSQLHRKQPTVGNLMERSLLDSLGRRYFALWLEVSSRGRKRRREKHAAAALAQLKATQLMLGVLRQWERFASNRGRQRAMRSASRALESSSACRLQHRTLLKFESYRQRMKVRRRWNEFVAVVQAEGERSLRRRFYSAWWYFRQAAVERKARQGLATELTVPSQTPLLAKYWGAWEAVYCRRKRRQTLRAWSDSVDASRHQRTLQCLRAWLSYARSRRAQRDLDTLAAVKATVAELSASITIAGPRLQKFRALAALKAKEALLQSHMDDLVAAQHDSDGRIVALQHAELLRRPSPSTSEDLLAPCMLRLKERVLNPGADVPLITATIERCRAQPVKYFLATLQYIQRAVHALPLLPLSGPSATLTIEAERCSNNADSPVAAAPTTMQRRRSSHFFLPEALRTTAPPEGGELWLDNETTQGDVRLALVCLADKDHTAASHLVHSIKTLAISYDAIPLHRRSVEIPAEAQRAIVIHELLLNVVFDALSRSLAAVTSPKNLAAHPTA